MVDLAELNTKHEKLRLSIQGMKTQQGYIRNRLDSVEFKVRLLLVSVGVFFATLIIGYFWR